MKKKLSTNKRTLSAAAGASVVGVNAIVEKYNLPREDVFNLFGKTYRDHLVEIDRIEESRSKV